MLPASAWASDATISASYGLTLRSSCTRSANFISPLTARKRFTISLRMLSAVDFGGISYVSGKRKPSMDLTAFLPSSRLNHQSGTPSASGSFAAAWKSSTGILVFSESSL